MRSRFAKERPIAAVPMRTLAAFVVLLVAQLACDGLARNRYNADDVLAPPPDLALLRIAAFGEPAALARLLTLRIQGADYRAGSESPYQTMDYGVLESWLSRILELDPIAQYPLLLASRVYADAPNPSKQRRMLDFVAREFLKDPDRRWPWLAQATIVAKHQLKDLALARQYAHTLQAAVHPERVPLWARQMEVFILEDMNEFEAARIMLGGMLKEGGILDSDEARFLQRKLDALSAKARESRPTQ